MANLTTVPFHGGTIEATQDERGVWVSLRRVCDALGIDVDTQRKKLRNKPWAVTVMMTATASDGKNYDTTFLHLDSLPMWLGGIETKKVAEDIRGTLVAYQTEAARVLRDHFLGGPIQSPPPAPEPLALAMSNERKAELAYLLGAHIKNDMAREVVMAYGVSYLTGRDVTQFLPALPAGEWLRPTQIAERIGVSVQRVGIAITSLGLRGDKTHCRSHLDKKAHSSGEVTVYSYDEWAVARIREHVQGGPAMVPAQG